MRRIFLSIIAISQLFGALAFFSYLDAALKQPSANPLDQTQKFLIGATAIIYLLGLIGAIVIFVRRSLGLWLSFVHQLVLIPLIIIPGGFFYVLGDFLSVTIALTRDQAGAWGFQFDFFAAASSLLAWINPPAGVAYFGTNLFALICAIYLYRLAGALADQGRGLGDGGGPPKSEADAARPLTQA